MSSNKFKENGHMAVGKCPRAQEDSSQLCLTARHRIVPTRPSRRSDVIRQRFGLPAQETTLTVVRDLPIRIEPGKLIVLTGASGSGKSTVLRQVQRHFVGARYVGDMRFPGDAALIDLVARDQELGKAIAWLTWCGLSEPRLWLRRFCELSEGQQWRARLALGMALHVERREVAPLICDEFAGGLHERAARALALNVRKLVSRHRMRFLAASSSPALVQYLAPDEIIKIQKNGATESTTPARPNGLAPWLQRFIIEPGGKADYRQFSDMHYRQTDELGFVDKVFVLRERKSGDPLGIVVYAHGPLNLRLRNEATIGLVSTGPTDTNRNFRMLRRLVIHPDVRGCGLGHYLVRRTLSRVGTRFVECLSTLGEFNPVFEKAGMQRVGQYGISKGRRLALERLRSMDVDPFAANFETTVCRNRSVRSVVVEAVNRWYEATSGQGRQRVERQSPHTLAMTFRSLVDNRPVYFLWCRYRKDRRAVAGVSSLVNE
ncbi:MAG: hypothetical protein ACYTHJ_01100 [Planctomycetota bacterium]|jgi:ABC-type dipeptide/oligopeptide/nickel transport system ATPase subunit